MTKFDIGDGMQGLIGVVGPTRMDYAKITARLSYFAESLSKMFSKPETPQLPGSAGQPGIPEKKETSASEEYRKNNPKTEVTQISDCKLYPQLEIPEKVCHIIDKITL